MKRALIAAATLALAACDPAPDDAMLDVGGGRPGASQTFAPANLPAFFDCVRERGATFVSAHRGGDGDGLAENAIATFESTLAQAPAFLEVDVSRTRDGHLVLMHDDTVDRTTNGSGNVSALTLAQFRALSLRDDDGNVLDAHPPSLRDALDWAEGRTVLELDVKRGVSYEDVAREVEEADAVDRVIFITYSVDGASRLARVAPDAIIYTTIRDERDLDTLERRGVELNRIVAWLGDEQFSEDLVEALAARGVEARVGMFSRGDDFAGAAHAGIAGVAVNDTLAAFREIDGADGEEGFAALQCLSAR